MSTNPFLFLAPLNGSLAFQDRAGGGTLTGAGAVRYRAAEGARWNLVRNPRGASNTNGWSYYAGAASATPGSLSSDSTVGGLFGSAVKVTFTDLDAADPGFIVNNGPYNVTAGHQIRVTYNTTYRFQAWVWTDVPGQIKLRLNTVGTLLDGSSINTYTNPDVVDITASSADDPQLVSYTHTVAAGKEIEYPQMIFYSTGGDDIAGNVWIVLLVAVDTGSDVDYFDGSTGGAWLDPITGILGTAHASPSVSQAVAWVEEGTTNLCTNPSFETNTTGWQAFPNTTMTRESTYAKNGSYALKNVCLGVGAGEGFRANSTMAAAATVGQTFTLSVELRGSGTVYLFQSELDAGLGFLTSGSATAVVLTDSWVKYTFTRTTTHASCAKVYYGVVTNSAQAVTFYADTVQIEEKAYATSYCDGSIGTGYAWSGTAHASASTRTVAALSFTNTNRISPQRGSQITRFMRDTDTGAFNNLLTHGTSTIGEYIVGYLNSSNDRLILSVRQGANTSRTATYTASVPTDDVWASAYVSWDATNIGVSLDNGTIVTSSRVDVITDTTIGTSTSYIGSAVSGGSSINGLIGPVAIANRPLTDRERTRLYSATTWTWNMLKSGFRHGKLV